MGSWCAQNLKDVQAWNNENLKLTVSSNEAAKLLDGTIRQLVSWIDCEELGGILNSSQKMLEAEPDFVMGQVLAIGMDSQNTTHSIYLENKFDKDLKNLKKLAERKNCTWRERRHIQAVDYFAHGEMQSACMEWEKILSVHSNDLIALKFAHNAYFFLGNAFEIRNSLERVIHKWKPEYACYSYLHGMYAFGLEECGQYDLSLKHAKLGLELNRQDCWATHAQTHCYEMNSQFDMGIKFLESTEQDWKPCSMLACHNFWHNALYYIEKGDYETALTIFDNEIYNRSKSSELMLDLVDAASLLSRLEMENFSVGSRRWTSLIQLAEPHLDDHFLAFNDAHISMILSNSNEIDMNKHHQTSISNFVGQANFQYENARITRDIGELLCDSIVDFNQHRYELAFEKLYPIRTQIYRIGGSHAQRDVFKQILINSALRSPNSTQRSLAISLIEERNKLKPNSPLADRLIEKHKNNNCKV